MSCFFRIHFIVLSVMCFEGPLTGRIRVILLNYREDGMTPYITVWKHALSEMKV